MLENDLARLASADPDARLADLEPAIWSRIERLDRLRQTDRMTACVQLVTLGAALLVSTAIGATIVQPARARRTVMPISSIAADLAPSSLLGRSR